MKNLIERGDTIEFTADADYTSGDPVELTDMICVCANDVANGELGVGVTEGVFELPKVSTDAIAKGATVYLNDAGEITTTATDNSVAGKAWVAAGNPSSTVHVKINA
nr:hypothetical protein 18 [Pseudomonadaceae bacterium]